MKIDIEGSYFIAAGFGKAGSTDSKFFAEPWGFNIKRPRISRIWHGKRFCSRSIGCGGGLVGGERWLEVKNR